VERKALQDHRDLRGRLAQAVLRALQDHRDLQGRLERKELQAHQGRELQGLQDLPDQVERRESQDPLAHRDRQDLPDQVALKDYLSLDLRDQRGHKETAA